MDNIRIKLKTSTPDGLVMLIPQKEKQSEEFLALALSSGRPELYLSITGATYNQGSGVTDPRKMFNLKAAPYVADGNWHIIQLLR